MYFSFHAVPCFFDLGPDDQRTARSILITVTVAGMVGLGRCGQYRQSHGIHGPDHLKWSGPDPPALLSSVVDTCLVQTLISCANSAKSRPGSRTSKPNAGDQGPGIPRPNLQAFQGWFRPVSWRELGSEETIDVLDGHAHDHGYGPGHEVSCERHRPLFFSSSSNQRAYQPTHTHTLSGDIVNFTSFRQASPPCRPFSRVGDPGASRVNLVPMAVAIIEGFRHK